MGLGAERVTGRVRTGDRGTAHTVSCALSGIGPERPSKSVTHAMGAPERRLTKR